MSSSPQQISNADLEQLTSFFGLLSDRTRLKILLCLIDGERNVTWLCNELKLPQPTISHHLGLLRQAKVIENRRAGKMIFYKLNSQHEKNTHALIFAAPHWTVQVAAVENELKHAK